jgi:prepilin signal peptidase PulO-like enzyme (type II secretory pathway)
MRPYLLLDATPHLELIHGLLLVALVITCITNLRAGLTLDVVVFPAAAGVAGLHWAFGGMEVGCTSLTSMVVMLFATFPLLTRGMVGAGAVKLNAVIAGALGVGPGLLVLLLTLALSLVIGLWRRQTRQNDEVVIPLGPLQLLSSLAVWLALFHEQTKLI